MTDGCKEITATVYALKQPGIWVRIGIGGFTAGKALGLGGKGSSTRRGSRLTLHGDESSAANGVVPFREAADMVSGDVLEPITHHPLACEQHGAAPCVVVMHSFSATTTYCILGESRERGERGEMGVQSFATWPAL